MLRLAVIAAVLSCAGAANAEAQVGDARAIAFRDDCASTLSDLAVTKSRVKSAGWVAVDPSADGELKAVHNLTMSSMSMFPGATVDAFSRVIGERRVYMMISGNVPVLGVKANGCYVYDFADDAFAADPDADRTLEHWLGAPPTESLSQPGMVSNKKWIGPVSHPEFATVRTGSIPAGSSLASAAKFSGRAWAATANAN